MRPQTGEDGWANYFSSTHTDKQSGASSMADLPGILEMSPHKGPSNKADLQIVQAAIWWSGVELDGDSTLWQCSPVARAANQL